MLFNRCCLIEDCADNEQLLTQTSASAFYDENEVLPAGLVRLRPAAERPEFDADEKQTLRVPVDFSMRDSDFPEPDQTEEEKAREMMKLQIMVRHFVTEVTEGVFLDVVLEDGETTCCKCCMDGKLSMLELQVRGTVRRIDMAEIQEICSGNELRNLRTTTLLDDLCVTMVMSSGACVSFKFKDAPAREHFATCMKVLRLALE
mmetsp:Transcript_136164/g.236695  ORF Transcript_136164/g.236695 Transcript_136164/m.236695 type:complete len:203 (+) Transcript_136164:74-682(+)